MRIRLLFLSLLVVMLAGCSRRHDDPRLDRAAELLEHAPAQALDSLLAIDGASLSEANRHYRDFLKVKAADKAYIPLTSDSLILDVISYYSSHDAEGLYPEALYYGARTYSDLGDYPTALKFFHDALDLLPEDAQNTELRGNTLSQCARLYGKLRLYENAIPLIKSVLALEKETCDTINIIYDLQLLGDIYLRMDSLGLAESTFIEALRYSENQQDQFTAKSQMYLASVKDKLGQTDSAICLIKDVADRVRPNVRENALSFASIIYYNAGMLDSAYKYAQEIIDGDDQAQKLVGYQIMLSPLMMEKLPSDSISKHTWAYRKLIEHILDLNQSQLALNQENFYNYQAHVREKEATAEVNNSLKRAVIFSIIAIATLIITLLYIKNLNKDSIIALHEAYGLIKELQEKSSACVQQNNISVEHRQEKKPELAKKDKAYELREKLKSETIALCQKKAKAPAVQKMILQSDAYQKLQEILSSENPPIIDTGDNIWNEIENTVLESSPNFKSNLQLLTQGKLSIEEYHTALLVKCGIKPTQIAKLSGRTKAAIGSRRESISKKILGEKFEMRIIDTLIRLL